ncbi:MAG: MgtC/SapB family protein [Patescibacteria group bacterium]
MNILELISVFFAATEGKFLIDILLATTFGYIIGAERESRGKDAGISTHIMVICGATLFTFMSSLVDPASKSRIAAQIVSGIGFLGAGLILKEDGTKVRNLTTASSVWFAGAIGMALGFDYHFLGAIATVFAVFVPRIPKHNQIKKTVSSKIKIGR